MAKEKTENAIAYTVKLEGFTGVNVRKKPSTTSEVVEVLLDGAKVKHDASKKAADGWIAVDNGYIQAKYLV